jgi:hypothetical protein
MSLGLDEKKYDVFQSLMMNILNRMEDKNL